MLSFKELIISYGHDKKLCLYNFKKKELLDTRLMESHVTSMKLIKTNSGASASSRTMVVSCLNGSIFLFEVSEAGSALRLK